MSSTGRAGQERAPAAAVVGPAERPRSAPAGRVVIEQAEGVVAERGGVDVAEAFEMLRRRARSGDERLTGVARPVVEGGTGPAELLDTGRSGPGRWPRS